MPYIESERLALNDLNAQKDYRKNKFLYWILSFSWK
jgi:hypothetical protein